MPERRLLARLFASSAMASCRAAFASGFFALLFKGGKTLFAHRKAKGELSQQPMASIRCIGRVGSSGGTGGFMAGRLYGLEHFQHSLDKLFVTNDRGHLF